MCVEMLTYQEDRNELHKTFDRPITYTVQIFKGENKNMLLLLLLLFCFWFVCFFCVYVCFSSTDCWKYIRVTDEALLAESSHSGSEKNHTSAVFSSVIIVLVGYSFYTDVKRQPVTYHGV